MSFRFAVFAALLPLGLSFSALAQSLTPEERVEVAEHFSQTGPKPGDKAPDFTLDGIKGQPVKASALWKAKPLVVITGSYSCPWFRENSDARRQLARDFADRARFLIVYTREAHPSDSISPYSGLPMTPRENEENGIWVSEPKTFEERVAQARRTKLMLRIDSDLVVDTMDNAVWKAFGSSPNCAYLIDQRGVVVARQGLSDPAAMRGELEKLFAK